ncbi:MAG: flagellin domain protein [Caloramator sp.]|jgi:flagellin|uniref:flagellin N-terminal helical domain-containing protein n=1 Tax=Caloramator sp. TaxID=1871330 RepID=UPI001E084840|nr:flagellin [Caloramator sp.]MBZ4663570.1 flagellin domain protein [Caloramator sp.]
MIINHNLNAMNAHRQLGINTLNAGKSMEKLSSGLRINRAGDDAAGLAISEKMRAQIRGLDQASRNAQDAISLIQTAEGALNETHSILQRMRELAVQSANDTNVSVDRSAIQDELDQLSKEISRIGDTTEFNTQKLLNGDFQGTFHIGANEGQSLSLNISDMRANSLGVVGDVKVELTATVTYGSNSTADITGTNADGTYTIEGTNLKNAQGTIVATTSDGGKTWIGNGSGPLGDDVITFEQEVDSGTITILNGNVKGVAQFTSKLEAGDYTINVTNQQLIDAGGNVIATSTDNVNFISTKDGTTVLLTLDAAATSNYTLSVGGLDVSTQTNANKAITTISNALEKVSSERAKLGAYQNRLEHTINNLGTSSENLTAAESRIRDVDMAKEMMAFSKNNILAQAAQAMLAQANQQPQGVLQLLR